MNELKIFSYNKRELFNLMTMKICGLFLLCLVFLHQGTSAPIGWSPPQTNDKTNHGMLAGVATSADPSTVYSWLMKLFSQRGFMAWLSKVKVVTASPSQKTSDSDAQNQGSGNPTTDSQVMRVDSGSPTIVRDYETQRSLTQSSTNIISPAEATPEIARDYAGNDMSIVARTQQPSNMPSGQFVTPITMVSKNYDSASQAAMSQGTNGGGTGTSILLGNAENKDSSEGKSSKSANLNIFPGIPVVQVKEGKIDTNNNQGIEKVSESSSLVTSQTSILPEGLQIARDRMDDALMTEKSQQKATTPDGLIIIRDVIEDQTQVPDSTVPSQLSTEKVVVRMEERTLSPGSNLVVLLPKTGLNFTG